MVFFFAHHDVVGAARGVLLKPVQGLAVERLPEGGARGEQLQVK